MEYLIPVFVVTGVSLLLGVLLILADITLGDYGECLIRVAGDKEFTVRGGDTLLAGLADHDYKIPASCGGKAICGYCKVKVIEGGGQILPTEKGFLTSEDRKNGIRLACQIKVKKDIEVSLPDFLETVRNIVKNRLYNPDLRWKFLMEHLTYDKKKKKPPKILIENENLEKVHAIIEARRNMPGPTIPILQDINATFNYLPEYAMEMVSREMNIPYSTIYRVSTFYNAFSLKPRGRNIIKVCQGTSCYVKGAADVLHSLEKELDISVGQNTPDLKFTLDTVMCIGCCGQSPVMSINDDIYGFLDKNKVIDILHRFPADGIKNEQVKA
jgi:NADH:ubiquinone oxidoreductase subunit E/ferredoxin